MFIKNSSCFVLLFVVFMLLCTGVTILVNGVSADRNCASKAELYKADSYEHTTMVCYIIFNGNYVDLKEYESYLKVKEILE